MLSRNSDRRTRWRRRVAGHVGERQRRRDHHRGERGLREVAQQAGDEEQDQHDGARADQAGQLGLGPGLLGHRGARAARADRKALEEAGGEVGRADADHLPLAVDLLAADAPRTTTPWRWCPRARRARSRARRRPGARGRPASMRGNVKGGKPCGQHADERHAVVGQVEGGRRRDRHHDGDEDAGQPWAASRAGRRSRPARPGRSRATRADGLAVGHAPSRSPRTSLEKASPSVEKPKSLGSWPTRIVRASPFM